MILVDYIGWGKERMTRKSKKNVKRSARHGIRNLPRRNLNKKIFSCKWMAIVFALIVLSYVVWFYCLSYKPCNSWDCFNENLGSCERTKFIGGNEIIFEYTVLGATEDKCLVNVKFLQGELNNQDSMKLEMQEMVCRLPRGVIMIPESNLDNCHGLLKENLQNLVIKKLYTYLVQNVEKISLEFLNVSGS